MKKPFPILENKPFDSMIEDGEGKFYYDSKMRFHREGGPAVERNDGEEEWYIHGELHREDGPALKWIRDNGIGYYYNHFLKNDGIQTPLQHFHKVFKCDPDPSLFEKISLEDLEDLSSDLIDEFDVKLNKWDLFYGIYFSDLVNIDNIDIKSFMNRIGEYDIRVKINPFSIVIY